MQIGVVYRLPNRHLGGMAIYLKNLIRSLKMIDKQNEYVMFDDNPSGHPGFKKHAWTIVWEHIWLQLCLPYFFWKGKINLGYFPNPPVSFFLTVPIVLTIPDVSFMHDAALPHWLKGYLWMMYFLSAHKARTITTFSENSKKDIAAFFKVRSDKIYVIPLAGLRNSSRQKEKTKDKYVITVPGTFVPRKNIKDTILAFKKLPARIKNTHRLVIVGLTQGEDFEKVKNFVASEKMSRKTVFTGRVSDRELSRLYSGARLFICTSLYEGFGLPVLEAMTCGTPVISYANSSLSEVVDDAGILVNDYDELSRAMQQVLDSQMLQNILKSKGRRRAALYTWDKTATAFITSLSKNVN